MIFTNVHLYTLVVLFHAIAILSIFDIYFKSPIVHGMDPVSIDITPAAKRVVVFSGDGLRADRIFEDQISKAPFLKKMALNNGTWGVSHTHVPTETRPCHLAMLGGVYEDVSAVTKGWQVNKAEFDTVFNESSYSWGFGAPDVIRIFKHSIEESHPNFEGYSFNNRYEDFSKDGIASDIWVKDEVKKYFERAKTNEKTKELLNRDKIVFLYHFNGLDTTGHAFRPQSQKYAENINVVDSSVEDIVKIMEDFYGNDGRTSYILTGDHGMSDFGNHGDGNPVVTSTPMIAWGAGIHSSVKKNKDGHDSFSENWGLNEYQRNDIEQADITPLVAALNGINFPMNSVGILPLRYLGTSEEYKAKAISSNAKQMLNIYLKKAEIKAEKVLVFKPFEPLADYKVILNKIDNNIEEKNYEEAINVSQQLINTSLEAMRYMQRYDWAYLMTVIVLGYIGIMMYSLTFSIKTYCLGKERKIHFRNNINLLIILVIYGFISLYLYLNHAPFNYYIYSFFPVLFWVPSLKEKKEWIYFYNTFLRKKNIIYIIVYFIALELLVFSYFHRTIYTFGYASLGLIMPFVLNKNIILKHKLFTFYWAICCCCTGCFALFNPEKSENLIIVWIGGILLFISSIVLYFYLKNKSNKIKVSKVMLGLLLLESANIIISLVLVTSTSIKLRAREGLPKINSRIGWIIFIFSLILPLIYGTFSEQHYIYRIGFIFFGLVPPFIILGISYEVAFYFFLGMVSFLWIKMEKLNQKYNMETNGGKGGILVISTKQKEMKEYNLLGDIDTLEERNSLSDSDIEKVDNEEVLLKNDNLLKESRKNNIQKQMKCNNEVTYHRKLVQDDLRISLVFYFLMNSAFFCCGNVASIASFSLESVYRLITVFDPYIMSGLLVFKLLVPFLLPSISFGFISRILNLSPFAIFTLTTSLVDIVTINFFFKVRDEGSWLEIGTGISHFCIANGIQIFILLFVITSWLTKKTTI